MTPVSLLRRIQVLSVNGKDVRYTVSTGRTPPPGDAEPGDIHVDTTTEQIWVRSNESWSPPVVKDGVTIPAQTHPIYGESYRLLETTWYFKRRIYDKIGKNVGQDVASPPPVSSSSKRRASGTTGQAADARPHKSRRAGVTAQPREHSGTPPNSWIQEVLDLWMTGSASRVIAQAPKGEMILTRLLGKAEEIPRITETSDTSQSGLVMIGKATRSGLPPSVDLAIGDLMDAPTLQFSDTTSNKVEEGVSVVGFISQLLEINRGIEVALSDRVYVVHDVPFSSKRGLALCQWSYPPFQDATTNLGRQTNCWTPPGAITFPHTDDYACGMYMIHWRGDKLWIIAPATKKNLGLMEFARTGTEDITTTLYLIDRLEHLHLFYATEEFKDYAFYLRPGTIHCCISVTESCHAGRPIRTVDFDFLPVVELAYTCALDWLDRLVGNEAACDIETKQDILKEMAVSIDLWDSLGDKLRTGKKREELHTVVQNTRDGLQAIAPKIGLSPMIVYGYP